MTFLIELIFNTIGGNITLIIISFVLLYYGAELLVRGSVTFATSFGVQKLIIGLTLVAFGTSMPEFLVSLIAKIKKIDNISVGNIVGSNIANIVLILGSAAIFKPLKINISISKTEIPLLIIFTIIFNLLCLDGKINFLDGIILLAIFTGYFIFRIKKEKKIGKESAEVEEVKILKAGKIKSIIIAITGIIILVVSSDLLIKSSIFVAKKLGVSELVIGLTMVAVGTSLPELFTSIVAAIKSEADISVGNVVGSNIFNIFFILGFISLFGTLTIDKDIYYFSNWVNLAITLIIFPVMLFHKKINRIEGIGLLTIYILYTLNLFNKWIVIN